MSEYILERVALAALEVEFADLIRVERPRHRAHRLRARLGRLVERVVHRELLQRDLAEVKSEEIEDKSYFMNSINYVV